MPNSAFDPTYYYKWGASTTSCGMVPEASEHEMPKARAIYGDGDWFTGKLVTETIELQPAGEKGDTALAWLITKAKSPLAWLKKEKEGTAALTNTPLAVMEKYGNIQKIRTRIVSSTMDGMIGLSPWLHKENQSTMKPFVKQLIDEGELDKEVFSLYVPPMGKGGELTLGGINDKLYTGDLNYFSVQPYDLGPKGEPQYHVWTIKLGSARFWDSGNAKVDVTQFRGDAKVHPDEAGKVLNIFLECEDRKKLHDLVITFDGSDVEYRLTPEELFTPAPEFGAGDLYCSTPMQGHGGVVTSWSLGQPFSSKYFSVYDYTKMRVGFAVSKHTDGIWGNKKSGRHNKQQPRKKTLLSAPNAFNDDGAEMNQ